MVSIRTTPLEKSNDTHDFRLVVRLCVTNFSRLENVQWNRIGLSYVARCIRYVYGIYDFRSHVDIFFRATGRVAFSIENTRWK